MNDEKTNRNEIWEKPKTGANFWPAEEREQLTNRALSFPRSIKRDHLKSKSLQNNAWIYQVQEASEGSVIVIFAKRFLGKH